MQLSADVVCAPSADPNRVHGKKRKKIMNMQVIVVVGSMLVGAIALVVGWLLWMSVWAAFWHRRLRRKWTAELLGIVMGFLFPVTVPAGITVLAVFWFLNQILGTEQPGDAPRMQWHPNPALRSSSPTHPKPRIHSSNGTPAGAGSGEYLTDRR